MPGRRGGRPARGAEHRPRGRCRHVARQWFSRRAGPPGSARPARRRAARRATCPDRGGAARGRTPAQDGRAPGRRRGVLAATRRSAASGRGGAGLAPRRGYGSGRARARQAPGRPWRDATTDPARRAGSGWSAMSRRVRRRLRLLHPAGVGTGRGDAALARWRGRTGVAGVAALACLATGAVGGPVAAAVAGVYTALICAAWLSRRQASRIGRDRLALVDAIDLLGRVEYDLRAAERVRSAVAAQTAGAWTTTWVLAALPAAGAGLGYAMGVDPIRSLLHTPLGAGCTAAALILQCAGLAWVSWLVRSATAETLT